MNAATSPIPVGPILDWLATDVSPDDENELSALVRHVEDLERSEPTSPDLHRCLDLLQIRSVSLARRFRQLLAKAALPLDIPLHRGATRLITALGKLAGIYETLASHTRSTQKYNPHLDPQLIATKGLALLGEQLTLSCLAGGGAPYDFWLKAHALALGGRQLQTQPRLSDLGEGPLSYYKYLLAFATSQPEGLTGPQICWLADYLDQSAGDGTLSTATPAEGDAHWFWLDPEQDNPPLALSRRPPPPLDGLLFFSPAGLAPRATQLLDSLGQGGLPPDGADSHLSTLEACTLLRRTREIWIIPPRREYVRRRNQYAIEVCCGLNACWHALQHPADSARHSSEWMVANESPTGYAVLHIAGEANNLSPGMPVLLRRTGETDWTLAVARWIRSDTPEQVEMGLEVLANSAEPVMIGFRGLEPPQPMQQALMLPAVPSLGRQPTLLTPAGSSLSPQFILLAQKANIYITQARVLNQTLQTPLIELFQYELDPYPAKK